MISNLYESNLVTTLQKAGMEYLIPAVLTTDDDDEGIGHGKIQEIEIDEWDLLTDLFPEDYEMEEDEDKPEYHPDQIHNIDELQVIFDLDLMDPEDVIQLNAWDLFNLTLPQFKLVKSELLNVFNIETFIRELKRNEYDLSIEQLIKWATVCAVTDCHYGLGYTAAYKHCVHISNLYDEFKAISYIRLYKDYLRFYNNALIMNERRKQINMDGGSEPVFDYELCPKPSKLKDLHNKAFRDYQVIETEKAQQERETLNKEIKFASETPDYSKFLYTDGKFSIIAPKSYEDFEYEGKQLNHCIESYAREFALMQTYIYFLRENTDLTKPYYSIEVIPGKDLKISHYSLTQCYTYNDTIDKTPECKAFIINWCKKYRIKINCEL